MTALDITSFTSALKVHYGPQRLNEMIYTDHPWLALVPKYKKFGGKNLPMPITYASPQGRSATFATAQTNKSPSSVTDFILTRVKDYSLASIDNETMEASMGDRNAFMEAATHEIDGALNQLTRSLGISLYRNGSGSIGQIGAYTATEKKFTLSNIEDVTSFEVGMVLVVSTADGGGSVRQDSSVDNKATITNVNRDTGVITTDTVLDSFTSDWAVDDYIFVQGDYDAKMDGLDSWVPATAPTTTAFFGVDRSVDSRLGGLRRDVSTIPIEEGLQKGAHRAAREGAKIDHYFVDYVNHENLINSLGTKVQYVDVRMQEDANIGFRGVMVNGPRGVIKVIPDQDAITGVAFGVSLNSWKLCTLNEPVRILTLDGLRVLRDSAADSVEVRCGYYGQLGCNAPGHNIRLTL